MIQLRIELEGIEPPIWRRLVVPASIPLDLLHLVIQGAMAWHDTHLHEFEIGTKRYGMADLDVDFIEPEDEPLDERQHQLGKLVKKGDVFTYVYDFGDNWRHRITVEEKKRIKGSPDTVIPCCLEGERATPPEDCGGPYSYDEFLAALADPNHPEHEDTKTWAGPFEPETFSVTQAHSFVMAMYYLNLDRRDQPQALH